MSEMTAEQTGTVDAEEQGQDVEAQQEPETDWKAKAREWEKRAKENRAAAERLAELEQAQMTEQERTAARLAEAERDAEEARREALRFRIATRFGVQDEDVELFLTGKDEETMVRQAERLAQRVESQSRRFGEVGQGPREAGKSEPEFNDILRRGFRGR